MTLVHPSASNAVVNGRPDVCWSWRKKQREWTNAVQFDVWGTKAKLKGSIRGRNTDVSECDRANLNRYGRVWQRWVERRGWCMTLARQDLAGAKRRVRVSGHLSNRAVTRAPLSISTP